MNKTNQFSAKAQYITPSCKTVMLQARDVILQGSGNSGPYGDSNYAGNDMKDDERYTYDF